MAFGRSVLTEDRVRGRKILEVGSLDVNGSLREHVMSLSPESYTGVDILPGRGVDVLCRVEDLVTRFGENKFDVIICTEMLEHVRAWRAAVANMKRCLLRGGLIVLTTRSPGFPLH